MVRQRTFLCSFTDHCSKWLEKVELGSWDPQKDTETPKGLWGKFRCVRSRLPLHTLLPPQVHRGEATELCLPLSVTTTVSWGPTRAIQSLWLWSTSSKRVSCGWADGNGPLRAWRAFQDPAAAESPRNPGASVQGCTQANLLLLLAASDLTECWVDSWGLPKTPKALCLCCNSCVLLSLLCPADHLDPHWTRFLLTPTVSLAISLSLTSVFTGKILEKKVTRQSGHHLTGSDCLQLSGQGQHHPGREQRWGARADSIITALNCPQRLQVTHRSERKMSS